MKLPNLFNNTAIVGIAFFAAVSTLEVRSAEPAVGGLSQKDAGDKAWEELQVAVRPPAPPAEWKANRPDREQVMNWNRENAARAAKAAEQAREFFTRYPNHPKAKEAQTKELNLITFALNYGNTNVMARFEELQKDRENDPTLSEDERFEMDSEKVDRLAMTKSGTGNAAVIAELEKGYRELRKKYPRNPQINRLLLKVANNAEGDHAKRLAQEIANGDSPPDVKAEAEALLKKLGRVGKPLQLKFKAMDDREIDLQKMAGKVVLIDFWATWCGPCMAELPKVKALYAKQKARGFEILGISLDQDEDALKNVLTKEKMTWPQYFSLDQENKIAEEFAISSIPTLWLVDKKGILRDLNGREDLEAKVEKLINE